MAVTLLILALYFVAVARVTRLLVVDKITEPVRSWLIDRYSPNGEESMRVYMAHCQACVSIWIGFVSAPAVIGLAGLSWWWLPLVALVGSQVTIWVSRWDVA